jgi:hypothetical protein
MSRTRSDTIALLLFALAVLEALYLIGAVRFVGLFPAVGADFRALYAAARIAREDGFAFVFDLERPVPVQQALCRVAGPEAPCVLIPMVFLPVFLLPILPLTFLGPVPAFALWSAMNVFGTLALLRPWLSDLPAPLRNRYLAMALVAFPTFANLLWGQSNLWLMLCVSLFLREWEQERSFWAGLWAGGLLLKPQTMVLLVPALALARQWRVLAGLGAGVAILVTASFLLAGPAGMATWARILMGFSPPIPNLVPGVVGAETMMNWRSLGLLLAKMIPPVLAWALAGGGMALTTGVALWAAWANFRGPADRERFTLGVLAATCAATWHAHSHTAMVLLPPLLSMEARKALPAHALALWSLLPAWVPFVNIALLAIHLIPSIAGLDALVAGKILFGFHLYFTAWAALQTGHQDAP